MLPTARQLALAGVIFALAGLGGGTPAAGDWLVTTDGSGVETRGPWQIKGRLVVFETAEGALASLRLADVDLAASDARTAAAKAARVAAQQPRPVPPPIPAPKARFVLTDADVGHVEDVAPESQGVAEPMLDEAGGAVRNSGAKQANVLEVASWDAVLGAGASGVSVHGVVKNPSEFFATGISIDIRLFDLEGSEIASKQVSMVDSKALAPGEQGSFRAAFPDVYSVGNAIFEVTSFNAVVSGSSESESAGG